ncbi:MAG: 3-hydroxyacyl-CoA dehydrogenase family protein [Deltaproteobacteria bacterium]|nr:3-hydroxyacyl-CoA dehydrogenase family protein [Deltaproteobacteria bacterium]MBW2296758.1 3-hydroxyacyl-CoA dehydrogenase family protein [Deltaproteobacteria bacterium]MBW2678227.1 3-hydroxyacyl-CoA dehydrogenase family protein [Deltaproteobacteria bacterium]
MERKNKIQRISVIGPGMMGHAIAQEFAVAGFDVTLCGRDENRLEEAMEKIENSLQELAQWELISKDEIDPALSRLVTTTDLEAAGSGADFIVESIVEVLEVKEKLFARLDAICPQHTILASNTSSLMPSTLAAATRHPDRFLIAHYFNPPYLMPLVEIVKGEHTADDVVDTIFNLYKRMHKRPIICQKEALGFIVNRLQLVLWREAFNIVQRGIASPQDVDRAVKDSFGRRLGMVGPFELYEYIDGYDLTLQCEKYILPDMETSNTSYPLLLEKVEKGELGAKTGRGFYEWTPEFTEKWRKNILKGLVAYARRDKEGKG